ncbi:MAG: NAD(P)/FAD-dependent oxidoreductase, partial [Thermomicrobiales bacterium]
VLHTERGDVRANVIVLAGEAYLSQLEKTKRDIVPATSHMVVTEPLTDAQWEQIGWENRDLLMGFGTTNGYIQRTADGRIAFGPFKGNYPFNSKISDELDRDEAIFEQARKSTLVWWPHLQGIRFTHSWGGVFGMPRDHMPTMTFDPKTGVATGQGYTGEGVATANLSGRVLADLITGTDSDLTRLPMTSHKIRLWEPEPIRWLGTQAVRKSMRRTTAQVEKTGRYPEKPTLAERLWDW